MIMKGYRRIIFCAAWLLVQLAGAQSVKFYSPGFEAGVKSHLGVDSTATVTAAQLDTIRTLNLSGLAITDIRDVANLPNIQKLNLRYNEIDNVEPLVALDSLREVDLSHNQLASIHVLSFACSERMTVDVSFNAISDFSAFRTLTPCCFHLEGVGLQKLRKVTVGDITDLIDRYLQPGTMVQITDITTLIDRYLQQGQ